MKEHFRVIKSCPETRARIGRLVTPHGTIGTPAFMPAASHGTVKTLTPQEVREIGISMILGNTYHLYLRPGIETIQKLGGLHKFMAWDGPILTDSGGYQVFSLAALRRIDDEGVLFRSHIDGSEHFLTPELVIDFQEKLGGDIIMPLDECVAYTNDVSLVRRAMERTHLWAERCLKRHQSEQFLYGIVQGGVFPELRRISVTAITSLGFSGYAIGGLSVGETKEVTWDVASETVALLPKSQPRYLMGVGSPEDIVTGVALGIDLFDSALPTRVARNGGLFTRTGRRNVHNAAHKTKDEAIDVNCDCYACRNFSVAYLRHLFKCEELLAYRLATVHNLRFIARLLEEIRVSIQGGTFNVFQKDFLANYQSASEEIRIDQRRKWLKSKEIT